MLLTCPKCRSGLEVPDGTTALVRCPACKTVFSPAGGAAPEPEEEETEEQEEEKPRPQAKPRAPARDEEEEDDAPRRKGDKAQGKTQKDEDEDPQERNRDFDPVTEEEDRKRKRKKRQRDYDSLDPEEKAQRRAAFQRAAIGAKLIWVSFVLFMLSNALTFIYYFQGRYIAPLPILLILAGLMGFLQWILAALGVGLCLSGPVAPGHWTYGIPAALVVVVHLYFLFALVASGRDFALIRVDDADGSYRVARLMPTCQTMTMFYLTSLLYPDTAFAMQAGAGLAMITGLVEMVRTVLILMLLSCLAHAALDNDVAHECTRARGESIRRPRVDGALVILAFFAFKIETNAGDSVFMRVITYMVIRGVYTILILLMLPAYMAARNAADACDEPFQSLIPKL